jgi:hypothetical protein
MALAATGAECASAATPASSVGAGHYRVESKSVAVESISLPSIVLANHLLAVIAVSHAIAAPAATTNETAPQPVAPAQPFAVWDANCSFDFPAPVAASQVYYADGRRSASLADANERQLLFVKITRG